MSIEISSFWSILAHFWSISDQFLISLLQILADFVNFLQKPGDSAWFLYILAQPCQPLPATRARPRPAAAAGGRTPRKHKETQWFVDVARGVGRARGAWAACRIRRPPLIFWAKPAISCIFLQILYISWQKSSQIHLDFGSFWSILIKFDQRSSFWSK